MHHQPYQSPHRLPATMALQLTPHAYARQNASGTVYVVVEVRAGEDKSQGLCSPCLAVAIDTSKSMEEEDRLSTAVQVAQTVVDDFAENGGMLSIVSFNNVVTTEVSPTVMDDNADEDADPVEDVYAALEDLQAKGGTNLYGGCEQSLEVVSLQEAAGGSKAVIVCTDGIHDDRLGGSASQVSAKARAANVPLHIFSVGPDCDYIHLMKLADTSLGMFGAVQDDSHGDLAKATAGLIALLQQPVSISSTVVRVGGVSNRYKIADIVAPWGFTVSHDGSSAEVTIPKHISAGETRAFMLTLQPRQTFARIPADLGTQQLCSATIQYTNCKGQACTSEPAFACIIKDDVNADAERFRRAGARVITSTFASTLPKECARLLSDAMEVPEPPSKKARAGADPEDNEEKEDVHASDVFVTYDARDMDAVMRRSFRATLQQLEVFLENSGLDLPDYQKACLSESGWYGNEAGHGADPPQYFRGLGMLRTAYRTSDFGAFWTLVCALKDQSSAIVGDLSAPEPATMSSKKGVYMASYLGKGGKASSRSTSSWYSASQGRYKAAWESDGETDMDSQGEAEAEE